MSSDQQQNNINLSGGGSGKKSTTLTKHKTHTSDKHQDKQQDKQQDTSSLLKNDYRLIMKDYDIHKNKSRPIMTSYEKTLIIGERATQIAYGAEPTITVQPGMTEIDMATEELRQRKCPFIIKRHIGDVVEYWRPEDLEVRF